jgi:ABC-type antimicrobial peptide transport system permease subunit
MTFGNWLGLVGENLAREKKTLFLISIGITAGVSALIFFLSLGKGVKEVIIHRLIKDLPAEEIYVTSPTLALGPLQLDRASLFGGKKIIDDSLIEKLKNMTITVSGKEIKAIKKIYRQLDAVFPASITGQLLGFSYGTDTAISGVDVEMVKDDVKIGAFTYSETAQEIPCLVPKDLLEVYNTAFAKAQNLPQLTETFLLGKHFNMVLGESSVMSVRTGRVIQKRGMIVGLTTRGTLLGVTVPIEYVREWNRQIGGQNSDNYRALVLVATHPSYVSIIANKVREMGYDARASTGLAERVGSIITLITAGLTLIAVVIFFVASLGAYSLFKLMVLERKKEMGLLMALGATHHDILSLLTAEALSVGIASGVIGFVLTSLVVFLTNKLTASIPFVGGELAILSPWFAIVVIAVAILTALVAIIPTARWLSRLDPAEILS